MAAVGVRLDSSPMKNDLFEHFQTMPTGWQIYTLCFLWVIFFLFICGLVQLFWNTTVPGISGLKRISFGQAVRLSFLVALLVHGPEAVKFTLHLGNSQQFTAANSASLSR